MRVVLTGPPGAGKSWAMEAMARSLREMGWVVARHYCYLEPGDPAVQERVALDAMAGNLISELLEDPRLESARVGLAGDVPALEHLLTGLAEVHVGDPNDNPDSPDPPQLALLVDGLDHVARVDRGGHPVSDPTDFASVLASLSLPRGAVLVVASQPGDHLRPFEHSTARQVAMPRFSPLASARLVSRLGLTRKLRDLDAPESVELLRAIVSSAEGIPLLVRFLTTEALSALEESGAALHSGDLWPRVGTIGDLSAYYDHLLAPTGRTADAGVVAEELALLEFPVTESELAELMPQHGMQRVSTAVRHLRPILSIAGTQGGIRIYHESLRRHVLSRLAEQRRPIEVLLEPITNWLITRGFFDDPRSYRHLLRYLAQANRHDEIVRLMSVDFVARSVITVQPRSAVDANLAVAAASAAEKGDHALLARVGELRRSAASAFGTRLEDLDGYFEALVEMRGPDTLGERLLDDSRPAFSRRVGLMLCRKVDEAGGVPPWREYLQHARIRDGSGDARTSEQESLDSIYGHLRLRPEDMIDNLVHWFSSAENEPTFEYASKVAEVVRRVTGIDGWARLLKEADPAVETVRAAFAYERSLLEHADGDRDAAHQAADTAIRIGIPASNRRYLERLGLFEAKAGQSLEVLAEAAASPGHSPNVDALEEFVHAVSVADASELDALREGMRKDNWFRRWLRFVVDVRRARRSEEIVRALHVLAADTDPFKGKPRACDLYSIHGQIESTFAEAIAGLEDVHRLEAIDPLLRICTGTTTSLQRSPSGPLTIWTLIRLYLPYATAELVAPFEEHALANWKREYYDYHAELVLLLCRMRMRIGDRDAAERFWSQAGQFISAYGFRKDVTLYELLDGLDAFPPIARAAVARRLRMVQPLTDRVIYHTDGSETSWAPGRWFEQLARVSPGAAADLLGRTILVDPRLRSRRNDAAVADALAAAPSYVPPGLLHHVWRGLPGHAELNSWLSSVSRMIREDPSSGGSIFDELLAVIEGDSEYLDPGTWEVLANFARRHGLHMPPEPRQHRQPQAEESSAPVPRQSDDREVRRGPFLSPNADLVRLHAELRQLELDSYARPMDTGSFAIELAQKCRELLRANGPDAVIGALRTLRHAQRWGSHREIFESVAQDLAEPEPRVGAASYVFAWCATRDSWRWFGGLKHHDLLEAAYALDQPTAELTLRKEIAWAISEDEYAAGLTCRLIEARVIAGDHSDAMDVWDAAFEQIAFRLPATGGERSIFESAGPQLGREATTNAYARLSAAGLTTTDYSRRQAVLSGVARLADTHPLLAAEAIRSLLDRDTTVSEVIAAMRVLSSLGERAPAVVEQLLDALTAAGSAPSFGISRNGVAALEVVGIEQEPSELRILPFHGLSVGHSVEDRVRSLDARGRVDRLARLSPDFADRVRARFQALFGPGAREVYKEQLDELSSRSARWLPVIRFHSWDAELLELAIDDCLPAFLADAVARQAGGPDLERELLEMVGPDVGTAITLGASREVRPTLPLPVDATAGLGDPEHVRGGGLDGWLRVGHWEDQLVEDDRNHGRFIRLESGVSLGVIPPGEESPYERSAARRVPGVADDPADLPLTGWAGVLHPAFDTTTSETVLTLRPDISRSLHLVSCTPMTLELADVRGAPAVAYRAWRMHPYNYEYGPPTHLLCGGELVMRPDLWDAVLALSGGIARLVTRVTTTSLPMGKTIEA